MTKVYKRSFIFHHDAPGKVFVGGPDIVPQVQVAFPYVESILQRETHVRQVQLRRVLVAEQDPLLLHHEADDFGIVLHR